MKFIPTSEAVKVENYPYGYSLKTTLTDTMEFNKKKGYRHVTQTINPKNGRVNNPKKSTYYPLLVRYYDENNHIKTKGFNINGTKEINNAIKFIGENFDLFTIDEIKYLSLEILAMFNIDIKAKIIYCGAKLEDLKPLYDNQISNIVKVANDSTLNLFNDSLLDEVEIDKCKVPDYNPFTVKRVM